MTPHMKAVCWLVLAVVALLFWRLPDRPKFLGLGGGGIGGGGSGAGVGGGHGGSAGGIGGGSTTNS